jgi:hypothetical protein
VLHTLHYHTHATSTPRTQKQMFLADIDRAASADADGDGKGDKLEGEADPDHDGKVSPKCIYIKIQLAWCIRAGALRILPGLARAQPNFLDLDSDSDNIPDMKESVKDHDGDSAHPTQLEQYRRPVDFMEICWNSAGSSSSSAAGLYILRTMRVCRYGGLS